MTERRFGFVQWEFAGRLGPDPGRYPVRRFAGDDVRVLRQVGQGEQAGTAGAERDAAGAGAIDLNRDRVFRVRDQYDFR